MAHRNDDAPLSVEEKRARLAGGRGLASHPAQSGGVREDGGGAEGASDADALKREGSPRNVPAEPAASRKAIAFRAGLSVAVCLLATALVIVVAMVMRG